MPVHAVLGGHLDSVSIVARMSDPVGLSMAMTSELRDLAFRQLSLGNLPRARDLFAQARERVFQEGWDGFVPAVRVADAALASAEGDHRRAAMLVGVAEAAFVRRGQTPDPDDVVRIAAVREAAVNALGAAEFARCQGL